MKKLIILSAIAFSGLFINSVNAQDRFHDRNQNYNQGYYSNQNGNRDHDQNYNQGYYSNQYGNRDHDQFNYRQDSRVEYRLMVQPDYRRDWRYDDRDDRKRFEEHARFERAHEYHDFYRDHQYHDRDRW